MKKQCFFWFFCRKNRNWNTLLFVIHTFKYFV
nr:MAG TPA: hypothetical protein [Caudoviricetes sp.]